MICPRCSVSEISATTGACELCGYVPSGAVGVDAPHPDATDELARAQLAHQFRIDVLLGQGPASAVYLAHEAESSRHVILKVLQRRPARLDVDARFRDAIAAAAALDHPHLVPVLRHGETDSLLWYSMEHRRARTLREVLRGGPPLDHRATMRIAAQIGAALDYLHRRGAIHGRLKPENVLVDSEQWVYVCDAIISQAVHAAAPGAARPEPGSRLPYLAPEDALGGFLGPATDQFALAVLIQECLTGSPPVPGVPDAGSLSQLRPDLPAHFSHAVTRALSERPNDRYPGMLDFITALESGASMMVNARPSGRASDMILHVPDWEPPRQDRPRWVVPTIVVGSLAAIATIVTLVVQNIRSRRTWDDLPFPLPASAAPAPAPGQDTAAAPAPAGPPTSHAPIGPRLSAEPLSSPSVIDLRANRARRSGTGDSSRTRRTRSDRTASAPAPAPAAPAPAPSAPASAPVVSEMGRLFVNASPWGQVFIDGQPVGNTPKANLSIAPGTHTIRVARDGFEPVERTVRVGPGESVRLTDLVLTPRP